MRKKQTGLPRPSKTMCPPGYSTASMLRDRLGISETQFRHLTRKGVIKATDYNAQRVALYSDAHLQMLLNRQADGSLFRAHEEGVVAREPIMPTSYTPEEGVKVLEMLAANTPLLQIVLQTKLLPATVKRIQQDYDDLVESVTIPKIILDQMNKCTHLNGSFPLRTATDILTVMQNAEQDRICLTCGRAPSTDHCFGCIKEKLVPKPAESGTTGEEDDGDQSTSSQNARQA